MQLWKAKKRSILERASENTNKAKSSHGTSRPIITYYYYYFRSRLGKLDGLNGFGFDLIVLGLEMDCLRLNYKLHLLILFKTMLVFGVYSWEFSCTWVCVWFAYGNFYWSELEFGSLGWDSVWSGDLKLGKPEDRSKIWIFLWNTNTS